MAEGRSPSQLRDLERLFLGIVLEEAIVRLGLLQHIVNKELSIDVVEDKLRRKMYVKSESNLRSLAKWEKQLKTETVRKEIVHTLKVTLQEVKETGSFKLLQKVVETKERQHGEEEAVFSREILLKEEMSKKKKELALLLESTEAEVNSKDEEIVALKTKLQACRREFKELAPKLRAEKRLLVENAESQCSKKIAELQTYYESLQRSMEEERLSHEEVKAYLEKRELQLAEQAKYWTEKLDLDTKEVDNQIAEKKGQMVQLRILKENLQKKCEEFEKVIEEENQRKERIRLQEVEARKAEAAIKIQRWWRDILNIRRASTDKRRRRKGKKGK